MPQDAASESGPEHQIDRPARRVPVLLPLPLAGAYDYRVPEGLELVPGDFVVVPLGGRRVPGVVWDSAVGTVADGRLKPVELRLEAPPMAATMRRFVEWVASYTLSPPGSVLRMAMSVTSALEPGPPRTVLRRIEPPPLLLKATPARRRVLAFLADGGALPAAMIAQETGVSSAVLRGLVGAGALEAVELPEFGVAEPVPDPEAPAPVLSADQSAAAETLGAAVRGHRFSATLVDGVTGSGKTEVYFHAIAEALRSGRQALVLLPEIALSAQWLERFRARFGCLPALWHSELSPPERRRTWRRIAHGLAPVVVGARSALYLPLDRLGVIVVDEEHEPSFKQEEGVPYHARDMAVVRARLADCPVVLVSATPSLETLSNVEQGRYGVLRLPDRHGGAELPDTKAIDLRRSPPPRGRWLTPPLVEAVTDTIARGEQVLLFLNRRGYAPLTLCRTCGHRMQCPNCSAWLVEHRLVGRLVCHHCGHAERIPPACPSCGDTDSFVPCGPGVERLAEEAASLWPEARLAIMASDLLSGPAAGAELVRSMAGREIDILIGTQMVAKGHHFPHLTLVGVVDADLGLGGGDLRAGERTFQLLHQVSGRAGRAEHAGRVLLQTASPEHPVLQALVAGDRDRFIAAETEERRLAAMPPFGRLAGIVVSAPDPAAADQIARALARAAPHGPGISVLGPAPAPLSLLRGRHRRRLLLKVPRDIAVQPLLTEWLARVRVPGTVRVDVDVDPYSFL